MIVLRKSIFVSAYIYACTYLHTNALNLYQFYLVNMTSKLNKIYSELGNIYFNLYYLHPFSKLIYTKFAYKTYLQCCMLNQSHSAT